MSMTSLSEIVCLPAPTDKLGLVGEPERSHKAEASKPMRLHSLRQRLTSFLGRDTPSLDGATTALSASGFTFLPVMDSVRVVSHSASQLRQCTAPPMTGFAALPSSQRYPVACSSSSIGSPYERSTVPDPTAASP